MQASTTGQAYLADVVKPDSEAAVFQDTPSMFAALTSKQIDAVMLDTSIVLGQAAESNGAQEVVAQFSTGEEYGAIYQKGSPNAAAFDKLISDYDDGRHARGAPREVARAGVRRRPDEDPLHHPIATSRGQRSAT